MNRGLKRQCWVQMIAGLLVIACSLVPGTGSASDGEARAIAIIGVGDTVSVKVYGEPDLDVAASKVTREGIVAVPLIGDIKVLNRSAADVRADISARFADGYLKNPSVRVSVVQLRLYYIKGEIKRPGGYRYVDGLSIEKAIALAGGFTERAAEDDISVFSEKTPERVRTPVSLRAKVSAGDVITIGESFF
ncbi:MAG: polysaccharide biosynthesis/export family protein [Pseudomonadota bacterium]